MGYNSVERFVRFKFSWPFNKGRNSVGSFPAAVFFKEAGAGATSAHLRMSVEVEEVEPNVTISPAACHVVPTSGEQMQKNILKGKAQRARARATRASATTTLQVSVVIAVVGATSAQIARSVLETWVRTASPQEKEKVQAPIKLPKKKPQFSRFRMQKAAVKQKMVLFGSSR